MRYDDDEVLAEDRLQFGAWPLDPQTELEILPGDGVGYFAWSGAEWRVISGNKQILESNDYEVWRLYRRGKGYEEISRELGLAWGEVSASVKRSRKIVTVEIRKIRD